MKQEADAQLKISVPMDNGTRDQLGLQTIFASSKREARPRNQEVNPHTIA